MANRSGTTYSAPRDANRQAVTLAASSADGKTPFPLEINPVTGGLLVESVGGSGGGLTDAQLRATPVPTLESSGLVPKVFDYLSLTYTGANITGVVYKTGGSAGTTVATLAITYSGSNISSVTRT